MPVMLSARGVRLAGAREGRRAPVSLSHHLPEIHKIKRCIMGKWAGAERRASDAAVSVHDSKSEKLESTMAGKGENGESQTVFGAK